MQTVAKVNSTTCMHSLCMPIHTAQQQTPLYWQCQDQQTTLPSSSWMTWKLSCSTTKEVLQSTPANVGARGNDIANLIAKADSHFQPTHDSISCQEATTLLKWKWNTVWHHGYTMQHDHINQKKFFFLNGMTGENHNLPTQHSELCCEKKK